MKLHRTQLRACSKLYVAFYFMKETCARKQTCARNQVRRARLLRKFFDRVSPTLDSVQLSLLLRLFVLLAHTRITMTVFDACYKDIQPDSTVVSAANNWNASRSTINQLFIPAAEVWQKVKDRNGSLAPSYLQLRCPARGRPLFNNANSDGSLLETSFVCHEHTPSAVRLVIHSTNASCGKSTVTNENGNSHLTYPLLKGPV